MTRQYAKAPLTEAVIQLTFEQPLLPGLIQKTVDASKERYPVQKPIRSFGVSFDLKEGSGTIKVEEQGFRLASQDGGEVLMVQKNTLTVSKLAPYTCWEDLLQRASDALAGLVNFHGFRAVSRLGVRYINRLDIPAVGVDSIAPGDWIRIGLTLPEEYVDAVLVSANRTELATGDPSCIVVMNTGPVASPLEDYISFLLDIDVVKTVEKASSVEDLFESLNAMRGIKNAVFESMITDATRALIQ